MSTQQLQSLKPGEKVTVKSSIAIRLVVTDGHTGLKVDFVVIAGQGCTLTAGTSPVTIEVNDLEDGSTSGLELVKSD